MSEGSATQHFYYSDDDFYLRGLRASDLEGRWPEWFNDPVVTRYQAKGYRPNSRESQRAYFDHLATSAADVVLAIVDRSDDRHVGNVGLHQIDLFHRTAVLGIVLGERSAWGRGIGSRAWRAITDYGFDVLGMHKICATVIEGNEASLRCALGAGYVQEGRQARQLYKDGAHRDLIHVGLLRDTWSSAGGPRRPASAS